ncbi:MAG: carboxypeptidase-like regulatory domain-containing protein, partial [Alphaproteobacteria bacterium]
AKTIATPGSHVDLEQVVAPSAAAAAEIYPALYWMTLLEIPEADEFPGTGDAGNGISEGIESQAQWLHGISTNGCGSCHQWGNKEMRELSPEIGEF